MWKVIVLTLVNLVLASAAVGGGTARSAASEGEFSAELCLRVGYDHYSYVRPTTIPDGDAHGVMIGPLAVPDDGTTIEGVILRIRLFHARTPDLGLRLCYDGNNDGLPDASVALQPYLARTNACVPVERYCCPAAMDGAYFFRDGLYGRRDVAAVPVPGEPRDPIDNGVDVSFSVFDGLSKGGTFYVSAVDSLPGDTGMVRDWTVYTRQPLYGAVR